MHLPLVALVTLAIGSASASLANFDQTEDLLLFSSWQTLKYWSSNSSLHSSRELEDLILPEKSSVTGLELYGRDNCSDALVWCDTTADTLYMSRLVTDDRRLAVKEPMKLLQSNFGSRVRLAVDNDLKQIYLCLYDFSRIDVFDIRNRTLTTFLSNITHPNAIAFDSHRRVLFWVEEYSSVSYRPLDGSRVVKVRSSNVRAIAVDPPNDLLYWSDSNGNIHEHKYLETTSRMIFSSKKMMRNLALAVTRTAIYVSDEFKVMAIDRRSGRDRMVLIESKPVMDLKAVSTQHLCFEEEAQPLNDYVNYSVINVTTVSSNVIPLSPINSSLTIGFSDNNKDFYKFSSFYIIIICLASLLSICLIASAAYVVLRRLSKKSGQRSALTAVKRINARKDNKFLISDKRRLIPNIDSSVGKTVCIEDLGSFSSFLDPSVGANRALRQPCSSCEDREECLERGICLTTYKLLT